MTEYITLDWDIDFTTVRDSVSYGILKRLVRMNRHLFGRVFIRASAHGNTHVKVELNEPIEYEHGTMPTENFKFMVRSYLRDDPIRHRLDETRYLIEHKENYNLNLSDWKPAGAGGTGRLWDYKIDGSMALDAGEWEEETF
jgi:hypothetical protein